MAVARRWLRRQGPEGSIEPEGLFHLRVYGVALDAIATSPVRSTSRRDKQFHLAAGTEDGVIKPLTASQAPEIVWVTTPQRPLPPFPANVLRVVEKLHSIEGHWALGMSLLGPGIRVDLNEYEEEAWEILCDGTDGGEEALRPAGG